MGATEEIIKMAKENNGTVTTAMVVAAGISRGNIKYLVDKGMIEKSTRGVYILPEVWDDEIFNLQSRFKRGIYSHETALFLWDLTDRTALKAALNATTEKRGSTAVVKAYRSIMDTVKNSEVMQWQWKNYQKDFEYATDIALEDACDVVVELMEGLG